VNIQPIILAAGVSSRMSSPKQLLPFQGSTLIRHTAEKLCLLTDIPVICITGHLHTEIQEELAGLNVQCLENPDYKQGMHTGIRTAIQHVQTNDLINAALISLTDQPLIPTTHYQALVDAAKETDHQIVATGYHDMQGVPALFKRSLFTELLGLVQRSGAKRLIANHLGVTRVVYCDAAGLDIDTDEDYQKLVSGRLNLDV